MGLIFVLVGVLLVLGIFTGDTLLNAFINLINYWPVILIFIGLSILSNIKGLRWLRFVNALLIVIFIIAIFFWPSVFLSGTRAISNDILLESIEEPASVEIQLDLAMVNVQIEAIKELVPISTIAQVGYTVRGSDLIIEESGDSKVKKYLLKPESKLSWLGSSTVLIKLNPAYNYVFKLNSAAVNGKFNIKGLQFERVEIKCAILKADFYLPEITNSTLRINAAVINGDIFIPENVRATMKASAVIKNINSKLINTGKDDYLYEGVKSDHTSDLSLESAVINLKISR